MFITQNLISKEILQNAFSYQSYLGLTENLLAQNKTTGENQSVFMIDYTRKNMERMKRIDDHIEISAETQKVLASIDKRWTWLILTEPWCGDAAQIVPILEKMSLFCPLIELKIILRDDHLPIMDNYLTNGGRSIPKLICLDTLTLQEVGNWGPRPQNAQKIVDDMKVKQTPLKEAIPFIHQWYEEDKTLSTQAEFQANITEWLKKYA